MKRIIFFICALMTCAFISAEKKVENFETNKWNWIEGADKYKYVTIADGQMTLEAMKLQKKVTPYQSAAHTFARIPMRAKENYKLTIKLTVPEFGKKEVFSVLFNTNKACLEDEENGGDGEFASWFIHFLGSRYYLVYRTLEGVDKSKTDKLTIKSGKNVPIEIVITKRRKNASIEINGVEIFNDECELTENCMGFLVPINNKLIVNEVCVEQADQD